MGRPSIDSLAEGLAAPAREACQRIAAAGARGWIVGGAVRDLALGLEPHDVDLASALAPATLERLFETTVAVGRAFGTVLLVLDGCSLQHTSFRTEEDYADGRRPGRVSYGETLEEDARRRDFTCNALYLDPLTDELRDPEGGLADLQEGVLRCVGDPRARFAEDGLRILRLARFAAGYGFSVDAAVERAAAANLDALRGVSPERVSAELERLTERPGAAHAVGLLEALGVVELLLAGLGVPAPGSERARRLAVLERVAEPLAFPELLAGLFWGEEPARQAAALAGLRLSRERQRSVTMLLRRILEAQALLAGEGGSRAARVRLVRSPEWPGARRLLAASADSATRRGCASLERFRLGLDPAALFPPALLESADLAALVLPRGPLWGAILREAEELQLEGELETRDQALAWLARRAKRIERP